MAITLLPFPFASVAMVQFGYPLVQTLQLVKAPAVDWQYSQWLMHWVICGLWMVLESLVLWVAVDYVPFFLELKLLFFLWLCHPKFNGAAFLWYSVIQPLHKPLDDKYFRPLLDTLNKVKVPEGLKTEAPTASGSNKENEIEALLLDSHAKSKEASEKKEEKKEQKKEAKDEE